MSNTSIRPERSFEQFSRGGELRSALVNMWAANARMSRALPDLNERIAANVAALMAEFDLTYAEFYAWSRATAPPLPAGIIRRNLLSRMGA